MREDGVRVCMCAHTRAHTWACAQSPQSSSQKQNPRLTLQKGKFSPTQLEVRAEPEVNCRKEPLRRVHTSLRLAGDDGLAQEHLLPHSVKIEMQGELEGPERTRQGAEGSGFR